MGTKQSKKIKSTDRQEKLRDPALPPKVMDGFGMKVGDQCGVPFGGVRCEILLMDEGDGKPRCSRCCRGDCRNVDSLSALCAIRRMKGRHKCKRHGGATRVGALHPGFKTGATSRWTPHAPSRYGQLAKMVAAGDPLDLSDDIHMVSARIAELLRSVDESAGPDLIKKATNTVRKLRRKLEPIMDEEGFILLRELETVLGGAGKDFTVWGEVQGLFAQRVKMVESQRKRDLEGGKYVTADDMVGMVRGMGLALRRLAERYLPDKASADAFLTDVSSEFASIQGVDDATDRPAS